MKHRFKLLLILLISIVLSSTQDQQQIILESPYSQEAKLGDTIVFKCKIKGLQGELQWCLDDFCLGVSKDLTLKGRPRHRIIGNQLDGEYNLQIEQIQIQDHMGYYCMATAASELIDAVKSDKAFLTVLVYPQLLQLNDPLHVSLNKPSTIQCIARKSRPPVNLLLSINGKIISDSHLYAKQITQIPISSANLNSNLIRNLNFKEQLKYFYYDTQVNITLDDVSMYWQDKQVECLAYSMSELLSDNGNLNKPIMTSRASIQVDYAPEVNLRILSGHKYPRENEVVSLICDTKATPKVQSYKWYLGNNFLSSVSHDTLNLKLRREMNLQTVSCEATNSIASVKASSQLNIIYKPYFIKGTHSFIIIEHQSCNKPLTLDCQVEANPYANITWYKLNERNKVLIGYGPKYTIASLNCGNVKVYSYNNSVDNFKGINIKLNDDYQVLSKNIDYGDFGLYECEASNGLKETNDYGESKLIISKRQIKLNPLGEPVLSIIDNNNSHRFNTLYTKTATLGSSLLLTCLIEPLPKYKNIIWLRDSSTILPNSLYYINDNEFLTYDYDEQPKFSNVHVRYENSSEGLKSYLYVKLMNKTDFGVYRCRAWNKYGSREVVIQIKEGSLSIFDQTSFFKNYLPHLIMSFFIFILILLFAITVLICYCKRRRLEIEEKDKELLSKDENSEKTINEWLATSSKLSNHTTLSTSQPCINESNKQEIIDKKSLYNSLVRDESNDSDEDFNKMIQDTTYRLSDLFKDLSPNLISSHHSPLVKLKCNSNESNNGSDIPFPIPDTSNNTLTRQMSQNKPLNTFNSSSFNVNIQPNNSGTSTFFFRPNSTNQMTNSSTTLIPQTTQYHTKIHSNMKKLPYTTLSKQCYNGTIVKTKNLNQNITSLYDDSTSTSRTEVVTLSNDKSNDNLQTIV